MPFYPADYMRDTMHLTRDEHGGYMLLIIACWSNGGRLLNKPAHLAAIVKATSGEWRKLAPVLKPFFRIDGQYLVHKRIRQELDRASEISAARREAGKRGGRPKNQTESKSKANGFANGKQTESKPKHTRDVTVDITTSETSPKPIQDGARDSQDSAMPANVIPLGGRADR